MVDWLLYRTNISSPMEAVVLGQHLLDKSIIFALSSNVPRNLTDSPKFAMNGQFFYTFRQQRVKRANFKMRTSITFSELLERGYNGILEIIYQMRDLKTGIKIENR